MAIVSAIVNTSMFQNFKNDALRETLSPVLGEGRRCRHSCLQQRRLCLSDINVPFRPAAD